MAVGSVLFVSLGLYALETTPKPSETSTNTNDTKHPLAPGPNDGRIAWVTARMLVDNHYSHHALDDEYSEKFFDRYLESLDPQRLHFTQEDIAEFDKYRKTLDDLTLGNKRVGDASPAFALYNRFYERLEQRTAYAEELLKKGAGFEFKEDERIILNRKDAAYPKDLTEAKELWRQRLRFEYLQEKLAKGGKQAKKAAEKAPETTVDPKAPKKKTEAEEITDTLSRRYTRNMRFFKEFDSEDVMQVYLTALAHIYDPHSDYFNKVGADNFAMGMNNTLFGIGAELRSEDGYCTINRLVAGGPAEKSKKLKEKDRIVGVAQADGPVVDVVEMSLNKVVQMIRGTKGTEVRLTIQPATADASDRFVVSLVRDEIKLEDQAAKAKIIEVPGRDGKPERLGVIDLPAFYAPISFGDPNPLLASAENRGYGRFTSKDVAAFLKKFEREKVAGVILDLRRNGGGSLEEAVKLTGLFIKDGPVVQVRDSQGGLFVDEDEDPTVTYDGPLIVLTSRFSASASEIVAGALQDYGRALIVGDQSTHGKGTVQRLNGLRPWVMPATPTATNDPGQLKVTMSKFYRASGASTQLKGVMPDIVLPSILSYSKDIGEAALDNALEWDTIRSAKFDKLDFVTPYLPELLKRSTTRISTNQDYVYIREDIEQFRKNQAEKTVSLNEQVRLKEKEENDARQKARDKELLSRAEPSQKVYALTLKQVDQPGLPAPEQKTNSVASAKGSNTTTLTTNAVASASTPVPKTATIDDDDDDEPKPSPVDATLEESERILMDYIALLPKKNLLSVTQ